jgi:hypothetical protein
VDLRQLRGAGKGECSVTTQTAPAAPKVARAVLSDRLEGLLFDRRRPNDPSRLQERLDAVLSELVTGVARSPITDESGILEVMERAIYAALLDGIEAEGIAAPPALAKYGRVAA